MTALTPDEIRQLLRECAVVVRPGETLVLRVPDDFTPNQVREYMDGLESLIKHEGWGFSVLPVMAQELAVLRHDPLADCYGPVTVGLPPLPDGATGWEIH